MATKAGDKTVYNANTNWDNEEKYLTNLAQSGNTWASAQLEALHEAKAQYTQPQSYAQAVQPTVNYQQTYAQATQPVNYGGYSDTQTDIYNHRTADGKWMTAEQALANRAGITPNQAHMLLEQGRKNGTTFDVILQNALAYAAAQKPDANVDYMALIQLAEQKGDRNAAAYYEQLRNRKITDQMADGNYQWADTITNNYADIETSKFSDGYMNYLDKGWNKKPTHWTDETLAEAGYATAMLNAVKYFENLGQYDKANELRNEWLYSKDYSTGGYVQGPQFDWSGMTMDEYEALNEIANGTSGGSLNVPITGGGYASIGGLGATGGTKNPQTTTYIDKNGNKQTGIVANSSYLDSMLNQLNQQYQQQMAQADTAAAAATQKAINALEQQKAKLDQQYQGMYEQLYINRRMNEKNLPAQLAAMGYTGGLTESALLQLQNEYQNNVMQGEVARMQGISDLDAAIAEAQLRGDLERANALMELSGQYYNNYAQVMQAMQEQANYEQQMRYQMLMQEQAMQESQMEKAAENGWILLENGILPDASTLGAMGLTAEQAQALMQGVSGNPVPQPKDLGTLYSSLNSMVGQLIGRGRSQDYITNYLAQALASGGLTQAGVNQILSAYGLQ